MTSWGWGFFFFSGRLGLGAAASGEGLGARSQSWIGPVGYTPLFTLLEGRLDPAAPVFSDFSRV